MLCATIGPLAAKTPTLPFKFSSYPTETYLTGKIKYPYLKERSLGLGLQVEHVREEFKKGPNFAGRYSVITIGCGSECVDVVMYDLSSGARINFPFSQEDVDVKHMYSLSVLSRRDSDMLIIKSFYGTTGEEASNCTFEGLVYKRGRFESLGKKSFKGQKICGRASMLNYIP